MSAADAIAICHALPTAQVAAVHMDTINPCGLTRAALRDALQRAGTDRRVFIPNDGERLTFTARARFCPQTSVDSSTRRSSHHRPPKHLLSGRVGECQHYPAPARHFVPTQMWASASRRTGTSPNSARSASMNTGRIAATCSSVKAANTGDEL